MPMIECTLIKGYDKPTRQLLAERVTDAACATIGAHPDLVIVTVKEVDGENYMRGRINRNPAPAPTHPEDIVKSFLAAMERRDMDEATSYLSDAFEMTFPGGKRFKNQKNWWNGQKTDTKASARSLMDLTPRLKAKKRL